MPQELSVEVDRAVLSGSAWAPAGSARSSILMLPGSGRSNRHNDILFPLLRTELLNAGHVVVSFDKRGVGQSTGQYSDTSISTQADDAICCVDAVRALAPDVPCGVLGHSQGGWVAFEVAARRVDLAFVVSNSGPAVGPGPQERDRRVRLANTDDRAGLADAFDRLLDVACRAGSYEQALSAVVDCKDLYDELGQAGPGDWRLERSLLTYEPRAAVEQIEVPTLVLHGADDQMIPVSLSIAEFERIANAQIQIEVIPAAGHRFLASDSTFTNGYVAALLKFVDQAVMD